MEKAGGPEGGPGPLYVAYVFLFRGYIIIFRFTNKESHSVTYGLSLRFSWRIVGLFALAAGPEKPFFFSLGPEPALGGPV